MALSGRRHTPDHVWIDEDGRVGVTRRFVIRMPVVEVVHLPEVGTRVETARPFAGLEHEKGVFDVYSPCDGVVVERNDALLVDPSPLLVAPESTWLVRVDGKPGRLLDAEQYEALLRRGPAGR